jgi:hypothetical protein
VSVSGTAPVLRVVIDDYLKRSGSNITPDHEADHLAMGMSLIASTRGVGLLPAYAQNFLPRSVTSRPLKGDTPTIDLVLGYKKSNESPILKLLLSRLLLSKSFLVGHPRSGPARQNRAKLSLQCSLGKTTSKVRIRDCRGAVVVPRGFQLFSKRY